MRGLVLGSLAAFAAISAAQDPDLAKNDQSPSGRKWTIATIYAPNDEAGFSETWISYTIANGYGVGLAYFWNSRKFRPTSTVRLMNEAVYHIGLKMNSGYRSMATGEVRDSALLEKHFGDLSLTLGIGLGSGFKGARSVAGANYNFGKGFVSGFQADGRNVVLYATYARGIPTLGFYLVNGKLPAYLIGIRF